MAGSFLCGGSGNGGNLIDEHGSQRWKRKRKAILARDKYTDQLELRGGLHVEADMVHHILPAEQYPQYFYADWNLISVSRATHELLHNRLTNELTVLGRRLMLETAQRQGLRLTTTTVVMGLPGSGKSTWVRSRLAASGGLAYDLDYLAAAFRLTRPHAEVDDAARRMGAAMCRPFAERAREYTSSVYIIRTAPTVDELEAIGPDQIVLCTKQYDISTRADLRSYPAEEMKQKISDAEGWASENGVGVLRV